MVDFPAEIRKAVEPHLTTDESVRAARTEESRLNSRERQTTLVTDRRVIDAVASEEGEKRDVEVSSFFISDHRIHSVEYERGAPGSNLGIMIGILFGLTGMFLLLVGTANSGDSGQTLLAGGILLICLGVVVAAIDFDGSKSTVSIKVHSSAETKEWEWKDGGEEIGCEISKVVGENQS